VTSLRPLPAVELSIVFHKRRVRRTLAYTSHEMSSFKWSKTGNRAALAESRVQKTQHFRALDRIIRLTLHGIRYRHPKCAPPGVTNAKLTPAFRNDLIKTNMTRLPLTQPTYFDAYYRTVICMHSTQAYTM